MARKSNKQKFVEYLFNEIETDELYWKEIKSALYVEKILHIQNNTPTQLYDTIKYMAETYWDYQINNVSPELTKEELITDMGEVLDTPLIKSLTSYLNSITVL